MGTSDILRAGADDLAKQDFFVNDLTVVIRIHRRGDECEKIGDGTGATDFVEHPPIFEDLGERDEIDRPPGVAHFYEDFENLLVRGQVEMAGFHLRDAIIEHTGGMEDRAEESLFGIEALRQGTVCVGQIGGAPLLVVRFFLAAFGVVPPIVGRRHGA